MIFYVPVQQV